MATKALMINKNSNTPISSYDIMMMMMIMMIIIKIMIIMIIIIINSYKQ